jgi:hypothetical protein
VYTLLKYRLASRSSLRGSRAEDVATAEVIATAHLHSY